VVVLREPRLVEAEPIRELDLVEQLLEGLVLGDVPASLVVTEGPKRIS
jgi:hypothetical protein